MSLVSADVVLPRTIELLHDLSVDLTRVKPPIPTICRLTPDSAPMLLWEVDRPEFVIDEADLPY